MSVDALSAAELVNAIERAIASGQRLFVGNHNLHSAYLLAVDPSVRESWAVFDYRLIDGFPILVRASLRAGRWLGARRRLGSLDWVPLAARSASVGRIAIVGASAESNRDAVEALESMTADSVVRGWAGENWNTGLGRLVLSELNEFRPDLVLVGLGMPLQERFLAENAEKLPPAVFATVGGAIDQLAGHQHAAPRWTGRFGVEWLWRVVKHPRRLAFRYFAEPVVLATLVLRRSVFQVRR